MQVDPKRSKQYQHHNSACGYPSAVVELYLLIFKDRWNLLLVSGIFMYLLLYSLTVCFTHRVPQYLSLLPWH